MCVWYVVRYSSFAIISQSFPSSAIFMRPTPIYNIHAHLCLRQCHHRRKATKWIGNAKHRKQFSPLSFNIFWIIFCVFYLFLGRPSPVSEHDVVCKLSFTLGSMTIYPLSFFSRIFNEIVNIYTRAFFILFLFSSSSPVFFPKPWLRLFRLLCDVYTILLVPQINEKHLNDLRIV